MHAWVVHEFGHYKERLSYEEAETPTAPAEGALLKVRAAGLNFPDILAIAGTYQTKAPLPFTPGTEVVGEVVEAGAGSRFKKGDRVLTLAFSGGFAEYLAAYDATSFAVPDALPDDHAAALLINYQTSYFALAYRAALKAGEALLVHGGAGGVGVAAIQLGKAMGARVIATASTAEKREICLKSGADEAIPVEGFADAVKRLTDGRGADVIYDPVGGDVFDASCRCVAWEGRILVIGFASGRIPQLAANRVLLKNMSVIGLFWGNYYLHDPQKIKDTQEALYRLYGEGKIRPLVYKTYPRAELVAALEAIESRRSYGKVVLGQ
jgi:NADPH2:quinone reductase